MKAIYKKEMRSYFCSPMGYVFIAAILALSGFFFTGVNLANGVGDMSYVFGNLITVLMIVIPVLTMRLMAEEKSAKTDQLLLTCPISTTAIVMGKLLAAVSVFMIALLGTLVYPLMLLKYIQPAWGQIFGNYIGFFLMGSAFVAIGLFISSLTENQIVAAVVTFAVLLLLNIINWLSSLLTNQILLTVVDWLSITTRFDDFSRGMINLESVIYYLSYVAIFVFLTVRQIEKRRWSN